MNDSTSIEGARSYARFLEMACDGDAHVEASEELHKLCKELREASIDQHAPVKGELTVKFAFKAEPSGIVGVAYSVTRKDPKPLRSRGILWLTAGGNLTPHNPKQQHLPLREVAGGRNEEACEVDGDGEVREV